MQTGRRNRANFADITGHPRPHWAHTGLESDQSSPRAAQARKRGRSNLSGRRHAPTALGKGGDDPEPAPMWWQVGQAIGIKHASDYKRTARDGVTLPNLTTARATRTRRGRARGAGDPPPLNSCQKGETSIRGRPRLVFCLPSSSAESPRRPDWSRLHHSFAPCRSTAAHERQIAICRHQQGFGQHPKPACQCE